MSEPSYYSMRQLSPYQGTVQVVEMAGFRAFSAEGMTWEVQISQAGSRYASYATWQLKGALRPLRTELIAPFIDAVEHHPGLPFPAADRLELWLLSAQDRLPLALINSTLPHLSAPNVPEARWLPALADDTSFVAPSLQPGAVKQPAAMLFPHHEVLRRCVRAAAGPLAAAQWFLRDDRGGGLGLGGCRLGEGMVGRYLPVLDFPELIVSESLWETDQEKALVRDYHHWQAANLLTHDTLSQETRSRLEFAARDQAQRLYRLRHVLPRIVNEELIKTLFVEAVIRQTA